MSTSRQLKRNVTHFEHYFASTLGQGARTTSNHKRILRYNDRLVQVFCTSKRRIIASRDYFLAKDEPLNRVVIGADIHFDFLAISLKKPSSGEICTKLISLANNQDLGEIKDLIASRIIELVDLDRHPDEKKLAVVNSKQQVIKVVKCIHQTVCRGKATDMVSLFTLEDDYFTMANVKDELICIKQDHVLRYNFNSKKIQKIQSNDSRRHLRFFKSPTGVEYELVEEEGFLKVLSGKKSVVAYPEPIEGRIASGSITVASLHEYASAMDLNVVIVTYQVSNRFVIVVLELGQGSFLCEFNFDIPQEISTAEFFFDAIYADAADVKYIKGSMIENDRVVYDLTLVQVESMNNKLAVAFPSIFPKLFGNISLPIDSNLIREFDNFGIKGNPPKTLVELHTHWQMPLIDAIIREGRVSLIESALRNTQGKKHSP